MVRQDIEKMISVNAKKKSYFIKWYVDSDKTKESFEKECKQFTQNEYETAIEWLKTDEEIQEAVKEYIKSKRSILMLDIYNAMYQKALKGDVKSAEFVINFFKSDFFKNNTNEIDSFLDGIEIEGLK